MHCDFDNYTLAYPPNLPDYWQTAYLLNYTDGTADPRKLPWICFASLLRRVENELQSSFRVDVAGRGGYTVTFPCCQSR